MVTSAVESVDDEVLLKLRKGHTRADFITRRRALQAGRRDAGADVRALHAVDDCRGLSSTCSNRSIASNLAEACRADSAGDPAARHRGIEAAGTAGGSATWSIHSTRSRSRSPGVIPDPRVDELQRAVMQVVAGANHVSRERRCSTAYGPWPRDEAARRREREGVTLAVHDRGVVLLRGTRARATRSDVRRVLLLATTTGYQIRSFGEAAEKLGVSPRVRKRSLRSPRGPLVGCGHPRAGFTIASSSVEAVVAACRGQAPAGVLAVGDRPTVLAAHVSAALGLPGNPPWAAEASRNKLAARRAFAAAVC